jgi:hypothetical protein
MALFLVSLLLVLTFNAYACLLPLPAQSAMDCSSPSDEPVRETCDAFLELGPQSEFSSDNSLSVQLEFEILSPSPTSTVGKFGSLPPPQAAETPTHLSISTTVLRI